MANEDKNRENREPDISLDDTRPGRAVKLQTNAEMGGHGSSTLAESKRDVGTHSPDGDPGRDVLQGPRPDEEDRSGTHTDQ